MFPRVQLRSLGRQVRGVNPATLLPGPLRSRPAAVCRQPIPDPQQRSPEMALPVPQKLDPLSPADRLREPLKIEDKYSFECNLVFNLANHRGEANTIPVGRDLWQANGGRGELPPGASDR